MSNVFDLIKSPQVKYIPDSSAIILSDKKITYSELSSLVDNTAPFLKEKGVKENDIVTLLFNNNFEFIVTILSLWEIGAIPVPLNTRLLRKDLQEQLSFLNSDCTIISREFKNVSTIGKSFVLLPDDFSEKIGKSHNKKTPRDKIALILFTSGSSGKPKAVMLSFDNLIQSALIGNKVLNQTTDDKWMASLPFYHIGGFIIIVRALMFGTSIIIPDSLSNEDLVESIKKYKPTLASLVSNQLKKIIDENFIPPKELRTVLLGGGFSDKELVLQSINNGWKIAKVYGSTETSSFVSFMNYKEVKKKPGASGVAMHPNKILIIEDGAIVVSSPAVMKGYYNNEVETSNKLKGGYYYTGDIGYLDEEGFLFVEAKRNDLIISGGENVNPVEIENTILSYADIKEVSVIGIEDEKWGQIVCAAIVLKVKSKVDKGNLRNFLRDKLAGYKIPKQILFVDKLPKTELGKVIKEKVKVLFKN